MAMPEPMPHHIEEARQRTAHITNPTEREREYKRFLHYLSSPTPVPHPWIPERDEPRDNWGQIVPLVLVLLFAIFIGAPLVLRAMFWN